MSADVNGLRMYDEEQRAGSPLVLPDRAFVDTSTPETR
jgi:hypothetical protein